MPEHVYSEKLGMLSDAQFQAALDRFDLGDFLIAEKIPLGVFGQNVFVTSSRGQFVLRGAPHFPWQFPTEQFYARLLHERTRVPAPWPYLIDPATDIFGWSYALMPRLPGTQLSLLEAEKKLTAQDRREIARAFGRNLALMHELSWPFAGRYDAASGKVQPFELLHELAWPFPVDHFADLAARAPGPVSYGELVPERIRHNLVLARRYSQATTEADLRWVEELLARAGVALREPFQPCFVMQDYKPDNLAILRENGQWRVSGVFDLMQPYFADGEADLTRTTFVYLNEEPELAREFIRAYSDLRTLRPGFAERFAVYMLDDLAILWEFALRHDQRWWPSGWTFRDWAERYVSFSPL
jgi:hygromycin-B 7''-O-kinase